MVFFPQTARFSRHGKPQFQKAFKSSIIVLKGFKWGTYLTYETDRRDVK